MSWDETPPTAGSKNFLKFKAGESIRVILKGDPVAFYKIWKEGKSTMAAKGSDGAKFRFQINAIVNESGTFVAKILEQGSIFFTDLKALRTDYNLDDTILKITRNGTGTDTTYSIIPLPGGIDVATKAKLVGVELIDLGPKVSLNEPPFPTSEDLPF